MVAMSINHGSESPVEVAFSIGNNNAGPSNESRSPLSNLAILGKLNPDKKQTKDGQPAKRRGPKPDSKPAMTRRQELNRQAQRTHRERKEMYIKALEQEVLRLKETCQNSTRETDALRAENQKLRDLLSAHGITYDINASPVVFNRNNSTSYNPSSSGSISGSYPQPSESTTMSPSRSGGPRLPDLHEQSISPPNQHHMQQRNMAQLPNNQVDYDQIGIDFVLTLERPCMDHMQYLLVRSHNPENQPFHHPMENPDDMEHEHMSGHALMSTAPPHSHIMEKPAEKYPFQMPVEMGNQSLSKLLDLSNRLPFDHYSEITPVMAWTKIYRHERVGELDEKDFRQIKEFLSDKVRCYGFGAVLEEFEVTDALDNVFVNKNHSMSMAISQSFSPKHSHVSPPHREQQQQQQQSIRAH